MSFGDLISLDFGGGGGGGGFDWGGLLGKIGGGFADIGKGALSAGLPALAGAGVGAGINALLPGKSAQVNLVDPRQGVTQAGGQMALERAQNIMRNPTSFGLPGDPSDPSTPAGKKRYDITQGVRSADAARGAFMTGGSAARETSALNRAVGDEYSRIFESSMGTLAGQQPMAGYVSPAQENPWAKILGGAVSPAVSKGLSSLLANWGMSA